MTTYSRQAFLARSALLVGTLAGVGAFAPTEAAPASAPLEAEAPLKASAYVSEFWVESSSPNVMEFVAMRGDDKILAHLVPPHSGLYMQYPFGRRVQADRFVVNGEPVAFDAVSFRRVDFPDAEEQRPSMVFVTGSAADCRVGAVWEEA